jgi:hypothetical protein
MVREAYRTGEVEKQGISERWHATFGATNNSV